MAGTPRCFEERPCLQFLPLTSALLLKCYREVLARTLFLVSGRPRKVVQRRVDDFLGRTMCATVLVPRDDAMSHAPARTQYRSRVKEYQHAKDESSLMGMSRAQKASPELLGCNEPEVLQTGTGISSGSNMMS